MVQKIYSKMLLVSCNNTHHDITFFVNHEIVKYKKIWISWEWNITVLWNRKIINLCLTRHIWRNYCNYYEVTFKVNPKGLGWKLALCLFTIFLSQPGAWDVLWKRRSHRTRGHIIFCWQKDDSFICTNIPWFFWYG